MTSIEDRMDPELRAALTTLPRGSNGFFDLTDVPATREAVRQLAGRIASEAPEVPTVETREHHAKVEGRTPVAVRLHKPVDRNGGLPLLVWFHGGGQVLGYAAQDDPVLKPLAATLGCAVAAVDYRLAPENASPAGAEDGVTAYEWLYRHAAELGLDQLRIGIAGASGGGCIAAAATLMLRDRRHPPPLLQGLLYPMLDDRNETRSSREIMDIGIWDRRANVLAWNAILSGRAAGPDISPYSAPARAEDLSDLPPLFLAVGDLDLFRDEGLDYAMRARAAGTPTELHLFPGAFHAFDLFAPTSRLAACLTGVWHSFLQRRFFPVS